MKLTYRGVSYEHQPTVVETTLGEVGGQYRSRDWRFRNLKKPPILQPVANLTYRGVKYNKPGTVNSKTVEPETIPAPSIQQKARALMMEQTRAIGNRQQSMLARSVAEIGSPVKVAEYWSPIQGKIHPSFRAAYSRFGAAMS